MIDIYLNDIWESVKLILECGGIGIVLINGFD